MLNKIIFTIIITSCFCFLSEFSVAQSNEQLVQEGISNYHHGNYEKAIELFNKALRNIASTQKVIQLANVSVRTDVAVSNKSNVGLSDDRYGESDKYNFIGVVRTRKFMGVSSKNQVTNPLNFHGSNFGQNLHLQGKSLFEIGPEKESI